MNKIVLFSLLFCLNFSLACSKKMPIELSNERPEKLNVLLILTDELGWQDVKCYDIDEPSPFETPNIDQHT